MAGRQIEELLEIYDAETLFERFDGDQKSFAVVIDPEHVDELIAKGWNIKLKPADDYCPEDRWILNVSIQYNCPEYYQPKVYRISGRKKVLLNEETISGLAAERNAIKKIDMLLRLKPWTYLNKSGLKAVVKEMYVTVEESRMASMYDFDEDNN